MAYVLLKTLETMDEHGNPETSGNYVIRGEDVRGVIQITLAPMEQVDDFDAPRALWEKLHRVFTELATATAQPPPS